MLALPPTTSESSVETVPPMDTNSQSPTSHAEPNIEHGRSDEPDAQDRRPDVELDPERKASEQTAPLRNASRPRKVGIVLAVCTAQFLNIALLSSLFISNPVTSREIGLAPANALWVIASFTLTFAGFLPLGGKLADLYCPQILFSTSLTAVGFLSLGTSFFHGWKGLLVFRGMTGVASAVNLPAGVQLLVATFPDAPTQSRALNLFGLSGALGDTLGLLFTGVIMLVGNWHWIPRIGSFVSVPVGLLSFVLIPSPVKIESKERGRWKRLDLVGAFSLTAGLVLLIFSITSGVVHGWRKATFIAPLLVSVALLAGVLVWELRLPPSHALLQIDAFRNVNFSLLIFLCLSPFNFWAGTQSRIGAYLETVRHKTPIDTTALLLPQTLTTLIVGAIPQFLPVVTRHPRWVVPFGSALCVAGLLLINFSDGTRYWHRLLPGFVTGSAGATLILIALNTAVVQACSPKLAGFAGAITNGSFQIGAMIGEFDASVALSPCVVITTGINDAVSRDLGVWKASAAGFWFILAWIAFSGLVFAAFYDSRRDSAEVKSCPSQTVAVAEESKEGPSAGREEG